MILRDPDGTSKRSGFVKFYYKKDGNAAIDALDGKYRDKSQEKPIAVSVAISKNAHASQHGAPNMHKPSMPAAPGMPPYGGAQMGMSMGYQYPSSVPQMQMQHMGQQPNYYPPGMMYQPGSVSMPGMMPSYGGMPMPGPGTSAKGPPGANLYINNIRQGTTDAQLRNTFSMFGTVVSAHIMSQGNFGFVSFDNAHSAEAAISGMHMNHNCPFATPGKALEVSLKKEKRG
jgi:RNA recognition motif-containing protein